MSLGRRSRAMFVFFQGFGPKSEKVFGKYTHFRDEAQFFL